MIRSVMEIKGYHLEALDGEFGKVDDFLFDQNLWIIRYLVADTGGWLLGRRIVLPPSVLEQPRWRDRAVPVKLMKKNIEDSPPLDEHAPVSRQHEIDLHRSWGVQPYWVGSVPAGVFPVGRRKGKWSEFDPRQEGDMTIDDNGDPYLRSAQEVVGYDIKATDDRIGHVEDFLMDDESWIIRYLVVDTRNWLPGRKVIISLSWVSGISWAESTVQVDVTREAVKNSPEFDPSIPANRQEEEVLFDYYGRPRYWEL